MAGPEKEVPRKSIAERKLLVDIRKKAEGSRKSGKPFWHWRWTDSKLEPGDDPLERQKDTFLASFLSVLPEPYEDAKSLRAYLEDAFAHKKGGVVAVEYGGPGSQLSGSFTPGFLKKSLGVALTDFREDDEKAEDGTRNHAVLAENVLYQRAFRAVDEWLAGDRCDIVFERMLGGLRYMPGDPDALMQPLQEAYRRLSDDGIMFVQTPVVLNDVLVAWAEKIDLEFGGVLEIQYSLGTHDNEPHQTSSFRIRKLPGAPEGLPILSREELRRADGQQ